MNTGTRADLAAQVREARKIRRWGQRDLADAAGVSVGTVSNFERGLTTPQAHHLRAILEALDIADPEGDRMDESGDTSPEQWFAELHDDVRTALYMIGLYLEQFDPQERDARIREIVTAVVERRL